MKNDTRKISIAQSRHREKYTREYNNIRRPATHKINKQRKSTRAMQTVFAHEKAYTGTQENREKKIRKTNESKKMCAFRVSYDVFLFIRRVRDDKRDEKKCVIIN